MDDRRFHIEKWHGIDLTPHSIIVTAAVFNVNQVISVVCLFFITTVISVAVHHVVRLLWQFCFCFLFFKSHVYIHQLYIFIIFMGALKLFPEWAKLIFENCCRASWNNVVMNRNSYNNSFIYWKALKLFQNQAKKISSQKIFSPDNVVVNTTLHGRCNCDLKTWLSMSECGWGSLWSKYVWYF